MRRTCNRPSLLALLGLLMSLGLAACGAIAPPVTPVPPTATPTATITPTVGIPTATPSSGSGTPAAQATPTGPGSVRVGSATGPGLPGVAICLSFAGYTGRLVGTTDETGTYQARMPRILHQEYVTIWAEHPGYRFDPPFSGGNGYSINSDMPITIAFTAYPLASPDRTAPVAAGCTRSARDFYATPTRTAGRVAPLKLTAMAVTRFISADNLPAPDSTTFPPGSSLYIAYTIEEVSPVQSIVLKLYRDGVSLELVGAETTFDRRVARYHGYYEYVPFAPGVYSAELYVNDDTTPSREVTFTVAAR